jgi:hypothetical protein
MPVPDPVQIPASAVKDDGEDLSAPATQLLRDLSLLPTATDLADAGKPAKAFSGTPDSVAVIESGATAISKGWAAGMGAAAVASWGSVVGFWDANKDQRSVMLWAAGIASSALVLAIGYIVASDVRGRAAATVATYEARAHIAVAMVEAARDAHNSKKSAPVEWEVMALPLPLVVHNILEPAGNEAEWTALMLRSRGEESEYWLVKDTHHLWVDSKKVQLK